jgi:hypothetical protein
LYGSPSTKPWALGKILVGKKKVGRGRKMSAMDQK